MMTDPDYKIEELYDIDRMCRYYVVLKKAFAIDEYHIIKNFDDLEMAKKCVRELRRYKKPIYHYVED